MTKKPLVIMALVLLLLVETALAIPKTDAPKSKPPNIPKKPKQETVDFTESASLSAGNIYLGNQIIDAGVLYVQDAISTGTVNSGDSPISGFEIQTSLRGSLDLNTYQGYFVGKWIITDDQSGAFEGSINGKVDVAKIYGKFVGRGTDSFEGQKIKGDFKGTVNNYQIKITIQATITYKTN